MGSSRGYLTHWHGGATVRIAPSVWIAFACAACMLLPSCSASPRQGEQSGYDDEPVGRVAQELVDSDPVSAAVSSGCTTAVVRGLSVQLVAEIQCLAPGTMKAFSGGPGLNLGPAVFPFLQSPAADALLAAQQSRGEPLGINSALRTLPQQFLLYQWYRAGACGISLAASPGKSNHESGLAVDVSDAASWRPALESAGFRWFGAKDPVHFDFASASATDLGPLSVTAFQRLWNRNHPEDTIGVDGVYGSETDARLGRAPVGGFARGAECDGAAPAADDAGAAPMPTLDASGPPPASSVDGGSIATGATSTPDGCAVARAVGRGGSGWLTLGGLLVALLLARRTRDGGGGVGVE